MKKIYFDNAATTKVDPAVFFAMRPYFLTKYGNASEYHLLGREAKGAIESSRETIASYLGADSSEIIFTSSATESINLAIKGLIEASGVKKPHVITSQIEHKAVLETCRHLEGLGLANVTYLPVDAYGQIRVADVGEAITGDTILISIMYVNNEVGTVEPIREIGNLLKRANKTTKRKIFFHTDATQAMAYFDCNVNRLGVDLLSFTGHKIYAPKGVGVLYVRGGTPLSRQLDGGGQEGGLRASTENVPYIVGMGKALELAGSTKRVEVKRLKSLQKRLIDNVRKIPNVVLTGDRKNRAPHIASFIVDGVEGEALVLSLSDLGIFASSGSACTSSDLAPSHVLSAMGIIPEKSHGSIRFSLGKDTTEEEINYLKEKLPMVIEKLRKMARGI